MYTYMYVHYIACTSALPLCMLFLSVFFFLPSRIITSDLVSIVLRAESYFCNILIQILFCRCTLYAICAMLFVIFYPFYLSGKHRKWSKHLVSLSFSVYTCSILWHFMTKTVHPCLCWSSRPFYMYSYMYGTCICMVHVGLISDQAEETVGRVI